MKLLSVTRSIHAIARGEIRWKIASITKPTITPAIIRYPAFWITTNSLSRPTGGVNQSKLNEKKQTRAARSKIRSRPRVTRAADGRTRGSRIGSHIGRTISPARPIKKIAAKPTVVVAKSSFKLEGVIGSSKTFHRIARSKYPKQIIKTAATRYEGFACRRLWLTSLQSRFRPKNHRIRIANRNSRMNFMYFRK